MKEKSTTKFVSKFFMQIKQYPYLLLLEKYVTDFIRNQAIEK